MSGKRSLDDVLELEDFKDPKSDKMRDKSTSEDKSQALNSCVWSLYAMVCTFCLILAIVLSLALGLKTCDKG